MKTFDEIYNELETADNNELNIAWKEAQEESKKAKKLSLKICFGLDTTIVIVLLIAGVFLPMIFFILMFMLVSNIIIFAVTNAFNSKKRNSYSEKYKNIVIRRIMSNFYDNLEYFPYKPMPEYIYREQRYEHYDNYHSDDYFEAQINNKYSIQMAEIKTEEEETYKDSEGNTHTRTITKFHGLFTKILMDKSINSELKILQNGGAFLRGNRLKMDSSEFEKYFDVQASNKIIGMQLLTADVMEELIEFENKTNMQFDVAIEGNELYLRFHSGPMFECGNLKNGTLDKELIEKYFYMLNFTYNLSNKLINVVNETEI